jgi:probable F420-dependent oxidoreductase
MKIGIAGANIAQFAERDAAIEFAQLAEAAGVESIWTFEHIVAPADYKSAYPYSDDGKMPVEGAGLADALDWIAFVAARTERIVLGTGMLILPQHNPIMVAKRAATIDRLSGGRLRLGVGVGWLKEEFDALGVPWAERGRRTDEYIQIMRHLWSGTDVTFSGKFVQLQRVRCLPTPMRADGIPIVIGGHSEAAAARAGSSGDGFFPAAPPDRVADLLQILRRSAENAGREASAIEIMVDGGPTCDLDTIRRYEDLGVTRVMIAPPEGPRGLREAFEKLHGTLISKVSDV